MGFIKNSNDKYGAIPEELKRLPNWICWNAVWDESRGKIKKLPVNPKTGGNAQSNNPDTWTDFYTAVKASEKFSGIGFMFGNCEYFGVDIDGVGDELNAYRNGDSDNIVSEFIHELQSYSEISQSGKGIHIICKGNLPKNGRRKGNVEMYETGRFFVMTGNSCSEYNDIKDCTKSIQPLHSKYIGGGREPLPRRTTSAGNLYTDLFIKESSLPATEFSVKGNLQGRTTSAGNLYTDLFIKESSLPATEFSVKGNLQGRTTSAGDTHTDNFDTVNFSPASNGILTVNDIVKAACNAKNGEKFRELYSGSYSKTEYASPSEADMALCNMLAFWTGCDADKMDAIFRQSGLMREKWDRRQSGSTYGALTIQKAIAGCTTVYNPKSYDYSVSIANQKSNRIAVGEPVFDNEETEFKPNYTMDDMGNAQRFVDLFGDRIRYCYTDKRWFWYDSRKWCYDNEGVRERMADRAIEAMKAEAKHYLQEDEESGGDMAKAFEKHIKSSRSYKARTSMLNMVQHHVPVLTAQLDRYKMVLNTPSGVLNLKNGELKEHKPEYYLTKITPVEYTPNAGDGLQTNEFGSAYLAERCSCPRWLAFLDEIFGGDKDLIHYIQKAVGYSLTGSTAEQCAFFLYGTGKNGKSTFLDVIRDVFGDYAANIQPETIMVKSNSWSAINSDIARLKGARLVTSVEPNEGVRINEGLLKQLTGDDTVTARKLYSEEFEFKPEFKLWMTTNHKPIIRGTDTGIWRRIHMIPFTVLIPEDKVDRNLKHKLKAEMTGIFKWCVDGCLMWQAEGLKMPKAVLDSVREYRREMDVISAFIEDKCELSGSVQSSVLYAAYSSWAEENNEYRMSATKFGLEIAKRFEKIKGKSCYFYNGISLVTNY